MKRLEEAGMTLNRSKCIFSNSDVTFFGHRVSDKGITPDPEKIKAITKIEAPTTKKELKSFLGIVNFLSKISPKLPELKRLLRELTKIKTV